MSEIDYKKMIKIKEKYYEEYKNQIKPGSYDYYLYHNRDNENSILWFIVLTPIFFLFSGGDSMFVSVLYVIGLWIAYFIMCFVNNEKMNMDPEIIKNREILFKIYLQEKHREELYNE